MSPDPIATYRVQFRPEFGFDKATEIVGYLSALGISHLYASPNLQAAAGSLHGYDVVDPTSVNEELGGAHAHARMCEALRKAGLGQMVDVVPNHMVISGQQNPWWWDVLENGPSSHYATFFDVDWDASEERWPNKVLLPVLGDHYGRVLEDSQLVLSHKEGAFILRYHDQSFPIDPSSLPSLLGRVADSCGSEVLAFIAESCMRLPRPTVTARQLVERRHRDKAVLKDLLVKVCRDEPAALAAIDAEVGRLNSDPDALDALIDQQNYRLAFWRMASKDLGYRRFFDINDLVGLRVEDRDVFLTTHALPISWEKKGWVQGLRIDHPDGLRNPTEYFKRLRSACPNAWIVAEKILGHGEKIPAEWPIEGTTGYDFLNLVGGLFIDPKGEEELTRAYARFIEEKTCYSELVSACKRLVVRELLGSELNRLTTLLVSICERHRRHRDYTYRELQDALCEIAVHFPVYRTYVSAVDNEVSSQDQTYITEATENAAKQRADLDPELFRFLKELLLLRIAGALEGEFAMRFQQLTGPTMAKGVEDTAFYRYFRLVSLNEVGGDPSAFGTAPSQFHKACAAAQKEHPYSLLATTTHDTKRSEGVRARLALLSEIPEAWGKAVNKWSTYNEKHQPREPIDRNTEYLFYQTLVGDWPISIERMTTYMEKAVREAKEHTSWTNHNEAYEERIKGFITAVLGDEVFCREVEDFVTPLIAPGYVNSLAQTLLKLTAPGIPDIYQGTELWDMGLVDPDNRRLIDYTIRRAILEKMDRMSPEEILNEMALGTPKMWVIRQALHTRRRFSTHFGAGGGYCPLTAQGVKADHAIVFLRGETVATIVPRLVLGINDDWSDTFLELPAGRWHHVLTGEEWEGGKILLKDVLAHFPVALLVREGA